MERKEPTLSSGSNNTNANTIVSGNERDETLNRRPEYDEPRQVRPAQTTTTSTGPLPAIALVVALIGVGGAGFLGWKFSEAQVQLLKAGDRITQLENQLNVTSTESTASLGSLQANIRTVDGEVKNLRESTRKLIAEHTDKLASLGKNLDSIKADLGSVKNDASSIKQDVLANKLTFDELPPRVEAFEKSLAEQRKKVQDVAASVTTMQNQLKNSEGLASRINSAEEAIDAIDDNRRNINRDLVLIKQQLGIKN
jgi:hypothetical protein